MRVDHIAAREVEDDVQDLVGDGHRAHNRGALIVVGADPVADGLETNPGGLVRHDRQTEDQQLNPSLRSYLVS